MKFSQKRIYKVMLKLTKCLFVVMLVFSVAMPVLVSALGTGNDTKLGTGDDANSAVTIKNPIPNPLSDKIDSIPKLIAAILHIVLIVGVPIVALAIIYSGFLFVKAQGKPKEIDEAKKAIAYTLIGAALLLGSWVLANALGTTVEQIKSEQPQ